MLSRVRIRLGRRASDARGFTLIELIVAMFMVNFIAAALFAMITFATEQTTHQTDKTEANQLGRQAIAQIIGSLHSGCIYKEFAPIQEGSTENKLIYENAYSSAAVPTAAERHEVEWNATTHVLTDTVWPSTGSWPNFSFPTSGVTPKKHTIATNITRYEPTVGKPTAIFQYFKYAPTTTETEATPLTSLEGLKGSENQLGEKEAKEAASVLITFVAAAHDGELKHNSALDISNQVTFSFSVPNAETPIHDGPCE